MSKSKISKISPATGKKKETKEIFGSDKTLACVYEIEYTVMDG
jgi:hypothetical protein